MDPGKLATFALVTMLISITPGPNMMFIMTQSLWRGARNSMIALAGLQAGNLMWFAMAGLGLGTVMRTAPLVFTALTLAGGLYLAWLGVQALLNAASPTDRAPRAASRSGGQALRSGFAVALGNPKSIVYVTALLPTFVNPGAAVAPQLALLALVALSIDVAVSLAYILAGKRLSTAITRPTVRRRLDLGSATVFLLIAAVVLSRSVAGLRSAGLGS